MSSLEEVPGECIIAQNKLGLSCANFGSKNILGLKKCFWPPKMLGLKKTVCPKKKFSLNKVFGLKKWVWKKY